jgi:hypothetical protein
VLTPYPNCREPNDLLTKLSANCREPNDLLTKLFSYGPRSAPSKTGAGSQKAATAQEPSRCRRPLPPQCSQSPNRLRFDPAFAAADLLAPLRDGGGVFDGRGSAPAPVCRNRRLAPGLRCGRPPSAGSEYRARALAGQRRPTALALRSVAGRGTSAHRTACAERRRALARPEPAGPLPSHRAAAHPLAQQTGSDAADRGVTLRRPLPRERAVKAPAGRKSTGCAARLPTH